jgi:hypothetical protein
MGFLDSLKKALSGGGTKGSGRDGSSFGGDEPNVYWIYAQCRRCGEPLKGRVNLMNDPSQSDDGETWVVRKLLSGSGTNRCFQTVEVTLKLDAQKRNVLESEAVGGKLITPQEYEELTGKT